MVCQHELVVCGAAGDMHSAVCTASGCVYSWGFGATGALGHGPDALANQTTVTTPPHIVVAWVSPFYT